MLLVMHIVYSTVTMAAGGFLMAPMALCSGRPSARKLNAEWLIHSTMPLFIDPPERPVFRHCCGLPVMGRNSRAHFLTTKEQLKTTYVVVAAREDELV